MSKPTLKEVVEKEDFIHVVFRPSSQFTQIRTPDWAEDVAGSVRSGAMVRMGQTEAGNWLVKTVLIPEGTTKHQSISDAWKIFNKIEDD